MTPVLHHPPERLLQAQAVRVLFLDVDGVLTDGGLLMSEHGETTKRFHTLDGHGIKLLQRCGIQVAVITGRDSPALRLRIAQLGITHVHYGTEDKLLAAQRTLETLQLAWDQAAAMGDDWPDVPVLKRCALAVAPPNAQVEVKALAHWVTPSAGGQGAVRDVCDLLLMSTGHYARLWRELLG